MVDSQPNLVVVKLEMMQLWYYVRLWKQILTYVRKQYLKTINIIVRVLNDLLK